MTRIKICGFTRKEDIEEALKLGIDYLGFNFYPKSPRYLTPVQAKDVMVNFSLEKCSIGIFVNQEPAEIIKLASNLTLFGVQLHGEESPEVINFLKATLPELVVIKAIRVDSKTDWHLFRNYPADFFLLDSFQPFSCGGTGRQINTDLLRQPELPWNRIFLAGGINLANVEELMRKFHPYGIDVATGVEKSPGIKDKTLMAALVEKVRKTDREQLS